MATEVKPATKFQVPDWHMSNYSIATNAERQRDASHYIRQTGRWLRNETDSHTKWTQHDNTTRLANRSDDIDDWKQRLELTKAQLDEEIRKLKADKELCEQALEAKALPLDVANENLTLRDGRKDIDLVDDDVEKQLKKEVEVIEGAKAALQQKCSEAFEQMCLLEEARQQACRDLQDKNIALDIDREQTALTEDDPEICFHPNPTRTPKGSVTPQEWDEYSRYNKARADAEMKASKALREAIHATIAQTTNDIEAQRQATEFAFRKRIHDMERAKDEDEWQKQNTEEEIKDMEDDIKRLEEAIRAKNNPLKLAMTRLENRTCRPNVELCRDNAQYGLVNEVHEIQATIDALKQKLAESNHALTGLQNNLHRINADLALKNNSLALDTDCMQVRQKLLDSGDQPMASKSKYMTAA